MTKTDAVVVGFFILLIVAWVLGYLPWWWHPADLWSSK